MLMIVMASMWDDLGNIFPVILTVLSVASFAGLGLQVGTVNRLRGELKDEREGRASDRAQKVLDDAAYATFKASTEAKLAANAIEIESLKSMATGEIHWKAIEQRIEDLINMVTSIGRRIAPKGDGG